MAVHVGTSGWSYAHWDGVLYPVGGGAADRLRCYAERFESVELNASFYRWPREAAFASWRRRLPEGFVFSVKAARGLTHAKRLYGPEAWVQRFVSCWHELGERRGVLLVQLGPGQARDDARLEYFLAQLPPWMRVAVEFRHPSWHEDAVFDILERHQTGYCVMSGAHLPCLVRATTSFVYVRLHGPDPQHLYGGSYSSDDLRWWADRIGEWEASGRDVYAYFNNDGEGHAAATPTRSATCCAASTVPSIPLEATARRWTYRRLNRARRPARGPGRRTVRPRDPLAATPRGSGG